MDHFAGLDVSVKDTSVCIVDGTGKIVREVKVASEPAALLPVLTNPTYLMWCGASLRLALLFGIGTRALPLWDSKTRRNNLWGGLAARVTVGPSGHARWNDVPRGTIEFA